MTDAEANRADRPSPQDDPELRTAQEERLKAVWKEPTGWRYFSAVNNDIVGKWYTLGAFFFFAFAGVLALLMRTQLMFPDNDFLSMELYNQAFTMHGTMMMFLFAVPVFEAVSIMLLPELLGNRDLPFPRLSAFGFWCFIIGGVFVTGSIFFGAAPTGGWFMYPPLSSEPQQMGIGADIWLLGLSFIEIASIAAAVELIVGVLKSRPPGMRLNLMPLYCWYVLVVAGMILFAFPPLIAGDLLLEMERAFDWPFFDPERGGDPILWQHLFWIFGHPEVYIVFLPSIAIVATIVPTFARVPMVGHSWVVLSAVGTAFISFGLWVHHMFTTGLPNISLAFFSAASEAVAIPTGVQIFAFIATLLVGRVTYSVPMLYATGALAIFVAGGLTGVMVAMVPFDFQAHDSYFVVAHLHYTLIGGVLFPLLGGIIYWYPFMTDKLLSDRLGKWAFWLMFGGFNIAFLPMHLTGALGMPRRVWTYAEGLGWDELNMISTLGAYFIGAGFAVFAWDVLRPKGKQPYAPRNVWNAGTMEFSQLVPAEHWGARCVPVITTRYPLWQQEGFLKDLDEGRFYLNDAEEGKRETMVTSVLDADPMQVLRVPGPSYKPMGAAVFVGLLFILGTFGLYAAAVICGAVGGVVILWWLWTGTSPIPEKEMKHAGRGVHLPLYRAGSDSVGWWAMFITMIGDLTAFFGLVFAFFFFWTIHPDFPPPGADIPEFWLACLGIVLAGLAWLTVWRGQARHHSGSVRAARFGLPAASLLAAGAVAAFIESARRGGLVPTSHAFDATCWIIVLWLGLHFAAGVVMLLYCLAGSFTGKMTPRYDADFANVLLYWHFMLVTACITFALLGLFPLLTGDGP
ncbi:cbb3-type cytochrome c oxidase subunit I [Tranquillimonas alkanivorans]|uniref:cytochrome-c oxidase n=1 Tax=Tranquillimonas alkanivorans TaxID=441119 RepID=A0A1I5QAB3_9RHOB|nr:cbb3-type cytochrome c oxidase subunit I [Tranquillimonas alkanivorans]SFP43254.1 cytochrome c oxidase subunit I+III [Tranquillimonas alkanivorans]